VKNNESEVIHDDFPEAEGSDWPPDAAEQETVNDEQSPLERLPESVSASESARRSQEYTDIRPSGGDQ